MSAAQAPLPTCYLLNLHDKSKIPLNGDLEIGRENGFSGKGVSRKHCLLKFHRGDYYVADLNSTNGTHVNGSRIEPKKWEMLSAGDQLVIGEMTLQFNFASGVKVVSSANRVKEPDVTATHYPTVTESRLGGASRTKTNTHVNAARDVEGSAEVEQAGYGGRFAAYLIDSVVNFFINGLVLSLLHRTSAAGPIADTVAFLVCTGLVFILPQCLMAQTLGMKLLNLKLVMYDGSEVTPLRVFMRELPVRWGVLMVLIFLAGVTVALLRIPSQGTFGLVFFAILGLIGVKAKMDGLFYWDMLCKTRVIKI